MKNIQTVFIRHGESQWNKDNRFTGWVDVDLSTKGYQEARIAGDLLKNNNFFFDYGYASVLKRSIHTLWVILDQLNQAWLPIKKAWQLNERHYGSLQGLNKNETIQKYGVEVVKEWRRSFTKIPPTNTNLEKNNHLSEERNIPYDKMQVKVPLGESLELTANRVIPYWNNVIAPNIKQGNCVIVVAHGNSIRAIIKFLNNLNESEIFDIEIPTGIPLIYKFDENLKPINSYFLY